LGADHSGPSPSYIRSPLLALDIAGFVQPPAERGHNDAFVPGVVPPRQPITGIAFCSARTGAVGPILESGHLSCEAQRLHQGQLWVKGGGPALERARQLHPSEPTILRLNRRAPRATTGHQL
jgi:hypothetical protein